MRGFVITLALFTATPALACVNDRAIVELIKERKITRLLSGYDANKLRNTDGGLYFG